MSLAIHQDLDLLARMETKVTTLELLRAYEQFELAVDEDDVSSCDNFNLRGPKQRLIRSARKANCQDTLNRRTTAKDSALSPAPNSPTICAYQY